MSRERKLYKIYPSHYDVGEMVIYTEGEKVFRDLVVNNVRAPSFPLEEKRECQSPEEDVVRLYDYFISDRLGWYSTEEEARDQIFVTPLIYNYFGKGHRFNYNIQHFYCFDCYGETVYFNKNSIYRKMKRLSKVRQAYFEGDLPTLKEAMSKELGTDKFFVLGIITYKKPSLVKEVDKFFNNRISFCKFVENSIKFKVHDFYCRELKHLTLEERLQILIKVFSEVEFGDIEFLDHYYADDIDVIYTLKRAEALKHQGILLKPNIPLKRKGCNYWQARNFKKDKYLILDILQGKPYYDHEKEEVIAQGMAQIEIPINKKYNYVQEVPFDAPWGYKKKVLDEKDKYIGRYVTVRYYNKKKKGHLDLAIADPLQELDVYEKWEIR